MSTLENLPGGGWSEEQLSADAEILESCLSRGMQALGRFRSGAGAGAWLELEQVASTLRAMDGSVDTPALSPAITGFRSIDPDGGLIVVGVRRGLGADTEVLTLSLDHGNLTRAAIIDPEPGEQANDVTVKRTQDGGFQVFFPRQQSRRLAITPTGEVHDISRSNEVSIDGLEQRLTLMNEGQYLGLLSNPGPPPKLAEIQKHHERIRGEMERHMEATRQFERDLPGLLHSLSGDYARLRRLRDQFKDRKPQNREQPKPTPPPATNESWSPTAATRNPRLDSGPPSPPSNGQTYRMKTGKQPAAAEMTNLPPVEPWAFQQQTAKVALDMTAGMPPLAARWIRAALLDHNVYREVALTPKLDGEAWLVFGAAVLGAGLAGVLLSMSLTGLVPLAGTAIAGVAVWMIRAWVLQMTISHWLKLPAAFSQVFRVLAFAQVPLVLSFVPFVGMATIPWTWLTTAAALRAITGADSAKTSVLVIICVIVSEVAARLLQTVLGGLL